MSSHEIIFDNYILTRSIRGYTIAESLGYDPNRSDYREVFIAVKDDKEYVIKIGRANHPAERGNRTFELECELLIGMSDSSIAPPVVDNWSEIVYSQTDVIDCIEVIIIVMVKFDVSYADYRLPINSDYTTETLVSERLFELIYGGDNNIMLQFHRLTGLIHGDIHPGNIVLMLDENQIPIKARLIDFECCVPSTDSDLVELVYPGWGKYKKHIFQSIYDFESMRLMVPSIYNRISFIIK